MDVVVDVDVQEDVHAADPHRRGGLGEALVVHVAERNEGHDVLRTLLHVHRRILHDIVDVGVFEQCDAAADDEFVQRAFGRRVQIEIGFPVDGRSLLPGHVHELEIRRPQRDVGRYAAEVGQIDVPSDRQRAFVGGGDRKVVEQDPAVVDADRVGRETERSADHRHADLRLRELQAAVQLQPLRRSARVELPGEDAGETEHVGGQKDVGPLQGESGDRRREVERAFPLFAVVAPCGQDVGAVQREPYVGLLFPPLCIAYAQPDVPEALLVVRESGDGDVAPDGQRVGARVQGHGGAQHAADGRGGGEHRQRPADVQPCDVEPDAAERVGFRNGMDRKPLVAVSHVEVGAQVSVEPVDEVIAGIHRPRLGAE